MHFNRLAKLMPAYAASGVAVHLRSGSGRGKSDFTEQFKDAQTKRNKERGLGPHGLVKFFIATSTPVDLQGFMVPNRMGDRLIADFTDPAWMITTEGKHISEYSSGTLVLEEFGQGEGDVKKASADLFLNGRVGKHVLPPTWNVMALSNRIEDRSGVTKDFDFRINRELAVTIDDDLQSWLDWAWQREVNPVFTTFVERHFDLVFQPSVPDKQGPWCTPRSLMMLKDVYEQMAPDTGVPFITDENKTDPVEARRKNADAMETAAGLIGGGPAAALAAMIILKQEMPDIEDIIKYPSKVKVPSKPDAQLLVCNTLAARADESNISPIVEYVERMPEEFTITFGKSACRRDPDLVNTKAFGQWAMKNASLMMAITDAR